MGWSKSGSPEMFVINGEKITNPKSMAEIQIEAFHTKISKLQEKLPQQINDPLKFLTQAVQRWNPYTNIEELIFQPVGTSQILKIIKEMHGSNSYGHDDLDTKSLKIIAEAIAAPITDIVNKSIEQCKFPSRWKLGKLVPLHKGGGKDLNNPDSFRPFRCCHQCQKSRKRLYNNN